VRMTQDAARAAMRKAGGDKLRPYKR
jgi:hypothetical protein